MLVRWPAARYLLRHDEFPIASSRDIDTGPERPMAGGARVPEVPCLSLDSVGHGALADRDRDVGAAVSAPTLSLGFPETDRAAIVALLREYEAGLGFSLDFQGFERELAGLPGAYAPPAGAFVVARLATVPAGIVAVRESDARARIAEMKRLYVSRTARGMGLGRRLAEAAITEAHRLGYRAIRLDTVASMREAIGLYQSLGFVDVAPYTANPLPGARFLEKALA